MLSVIDHPAWELFDNQIGAYYRLNPRWTLECRQDNIELCFDNNLVVVYHAMNLEDAALFAFNYVVKREAERRTCALPH